ncbi:ATP-grasp ribosomal peptide maturase [Longispora fulva]|uniref:ATP-grasp ribosomal peptide maturase n=1 Tax=Longispora fulva TaxID=619741 RepID=A0A8J7GBR5_9ACTN|nr:ATP-grasp ribosomal peptide maturase [Longispora fulva]MBG6134591.1 ATP-grasp ribosomal peptide maturase [Longispora fulva]GIG61798.1 ATP-grasp ribosomal peptide maturase [Longispora fulva]
MIANTVLVLTSEEDSTADLVIDELRKREASIVRMDTGDFPTGLRLSAHISDEGWRGRIDGDDAAVDLSQVEAVYYRRPTRFVLPEGMSDGDAVFATVEARLGFGGVLAALDTRWVNHPHRVAAAEYKPVGLRAATRCGLRVPRTLITNDHATLVEFAATVGGPVICKTLGSVVLTEGSEPLMTYTTRIDPEAVDPAQLAATAHLIQARVPKAFEVRVTMVGRTSLAVAIHADSDRGREDWRGDFASLRYEIMNTPPQVAGQMAAYMDVLGLLYCAFDFVVDPDHLWWFLEGNPMGQWGWLQEETGAPIAATLADLLVNGTGTC